MTRRGSLCHAVTRLTIAAPTHHQTGRGANVTTALWLCHRGHVDITGPDGSVRLGPLDSWLVEPCTPAVLHLVPSGPAELYLIEMSRRPALPPMVRSR
jgi:environmental stress-induced protein Ves